MVTKRSAKDLDMSETVNRLESVTDRNIVVIVKFVLVALIIAVLNRLLLLDVKTESIGTFVLANIKTWVIALAAIFATTVGPNLWFFHHPDAKNKTNYILIH